MRAYLWTVILLHGLGVVSVKQPMGRIVALAFMLWEITLLMGLS